MSGDKFVMRVSCGTLACLLVFVLIILLLHGIREDYDGHSQLISELALGKGGFMMIFAFLALAGACICLSSALSRAFHKNRSLLLNRMQALSFGFAAAGFLGAGAITLQEDAPTHIACVLLAFTTLLLAMFIVLRAAPCRALRRGALMAILVVIVALLPIGLQAGEAQRLIASGILGWMAYVGIFLLSQSGARPRKTSTLKTSARN
ncbi:MAG: DUF998 domain-containing protein [Zoogloeaceae bacterium]|jgi:hypothetical protein|nr:DUF998 domain-containing protein [Zoogloeaceae bacterium]